MIKLATIYFLSIMTNNTFLSVVEGIKCCSNISIEAIKQRPTYLHFSMKKTDRD